MSIFWNNALSIMEKKGLRKKDLIECIGSPGSTLHTWIKIDRLPPIEAALKIADRLDVSVRYLVTGEDDRELSPLEQELLEACEGLSKDKMDAVISVAKAFKRDADREKGSVSPDTSVSEVV